MKMKLIKFALKRYANFGSHVAAFLAGLGCVVSGWYFWIPLVVAVVLGSVCAYFNRPKQKKVDTPAPVSSPVSDSDLQSLLIQQLLSQVKGD